MGIFCNGILLQTDYLLTWDDYSPMNKYENEIILEIFLVLFSLSHPLRKMTENDFCNYDTSYLVSYFHLSSAIKFLK